MNKRTNGTRLLLLLLAALLALTLLGCKKAETPVTEKTITVKVTFPDGKEKTYPVTTGDEMLGDALMHAGLIEGEMQQYGLFIQSVDGVAADASAGEYWIFTKSEEWVTTGADQTPIADGDNFEFFILK